ncbi:MAG: TraB/GumN family protein [Myxococcota bacterium]|jgi:pheromone shutdown-related protein TraB|nr:TraB/GumN family protein [Myxococcota bacterium]
MDTLGDQELESEDPTSSSNDYGDDVRILDVHGRRFYLVGTAHISQHSVDLVRQVIEREQPDCVCVELDQQRYEALSQEKTFEAQDLREVIRNRQLAALLMNLLLASYQKRLGMKLGVTPGKELLEATRTAEENEIPISLCDRDVRITLRRAWAAISFWHKVQLASGIMASAFENTEISEDELARIRRQDVLSELMRELGEAMPKLKTSLIDERDAYLAHKIIESEGQKIVAVVGAGHVEGMSRAIEAGEAIDLGELETIDPVSNLWKWIGWAIPTLIVGSIGWIGYSQGFARAGENALFWFLANAIPSGLGGLLAFAHPLTSLAAFFAAPFTSLTPLIGAGYVAAFVQTWLVPPTVQEIRSVGEEIATARGWWTNRLLRILLVFILTTLGSVIGTWVGGVEIVSNLFG